MSRARSHRPSRIPTDGEHFNERLLCSSHKSQAVAKKIFKHWIRLVCDGERGQVQTTAAYSSWQKGRVEQRIATIKERRGGAPCQLSATRLPTRWDKQQGGRAPLPSPLPPAARVFGQRMKVHGKQMKDGEVVLHPKVVDEGDELTRRFIIRASAREALEKHAASAAIRRAAATRSRQMKTFDTGTQCLFTDTTQTN